MELKLVPKLQLGLVMTPQLKMAIKLLTLNHLELRDAVAQELVENPVLEEVHDDPRLPQESREAEQSTPTAQSERPAEVSTTPSAQEPSIDWEAYADQYNYLPPSAGSGKDSGFDDLPGIDQTLTRSETLEEHLLWQVRMSDMNALERSIAVRLLGEMRDYAGREPVKAVAAAFAAGVMINLLPTRVLVASVTAVGGALLRPALLSLGVIKSLELCCQKPTT